MKKNWFAVYTKARCEIKVASLLTKKKIQNYCPLNRISIGDEHTKKYTYEALFPSLVFVYALDAEIAVIKQTGSVVNFLYWLGNPAIIAEAEINDIKNFTDLYTDIKLEKATVGSGMIRIISEPIGEINSNVNSVKSKKLKVFLPSLGYILIVGAEETNTAIFNLKRNKLVS